MIEHESIPYQEALDLNQLGYEKPFVGWEQHGDKGVMSPSYAQAFRWFREEHNLGAIVSQFGYAIENQYGQVVYTISEEKNVSSYEEAELACLKALIQIVKTYTRNDKM